MEEEEEEKGEKHKCLVDAFGSSALNVLAKLK